MKIFRKTLKVTAIVLVVLLIAAFLIPIVFKKQITNLVRKEVNKALNAKVDFSDVRLSLFRNFPKVSISIKDFSIIGVNEFAGDTLITTKRADASANLFNVIRGKDIKIYGASLESPRIHALVNAEGKANWDIAKEDTSTTTPDDTTASAFKMSLKKYKISDGYIVYNDQSSKVYMELSGVDHEGSGDFTEDIFTLSTHTKTDAASFIQANIPYLVQTRAIIDADIRIDNTTNTYSFTTDDILLNNLKLSAGGFFQLVNDSTYNMDIKFKSPSNDFKDILSMIPTIYKKDFDKLKTTGNAAFEGFVKGVYGTNQLPAYDVNLEIKNASFQYPDLPKAVKNIQLDLHAVNMDGKPDNAVLDISKGHLEMDNEPFDFRFLLKNPETEKYIDAAAKGKLDLSQLTQFVKLTEGTKIAGLIWADAFIKGNMSAIQKQQGAFTAGGFFDIKNLEYAAGNFPQPIKNGNMKIQLTNAGAVADKTLINITAGHVEVGNDPVDFTLQLRNPVSTADFTGTAKGSFTLDNVKQFTTLEPGTSISGMLNADISFSGNKTIIEKGEYEKVSTSGTAGLSNVMYKAKEYPTGIYILNTTASLAKSNVNITAFSGNYLQSNFSGNGVLNNLVGFIMNNDPLKGSLHMTVDKMNLNDWMGTEEAAPIAKTGAPPPADPAPFLVPSNMDITLNAKAGQVTYDKVNYNNINGDLVLRDETVRFQNVKTEALDGTIILNGSYSTKTSKSNPDIAISYDVKDVSVQKAFFSFNTVRSLMPIGKFLDGKLNSQLNMTGNLQGDMMPDLASLTGKGNLLLLEGVLRKFAPLEKLAATLNIDRLKTISVRDIKNSIEFANGKVFVKPFTVKVDDIVMQIGGMHGFDQTLDYIIGMKLPRKYMGTSGNNLVNGLASQANAKGIPVKLGEVVDLNVKMVGTLSNPSIKVELGNAIEDLKEQAKDFAKQKLDSVKNKAKDSLANVGKKVTDNLKDKLKEQVFGKDTTKTIQDSTRKKQEPAIKQTIKDLFNRPKKNVKDTTKNNP